MTSNPVPQTQERMTPLTDEERGIVDFMKHLDGNGWTGPLDGGTMALVGIIDRLSDSLSDALKREQLAVAEEREACAKLCDIAIEERRQWIGKMNSANIEANMAAELASAIRARQALVTTSTQKGEKK